MGYNNPDVYYNPEKFGLSIVGEVDWMEESYEYDIFVVWVDGNGVYYWGSDSGCSCASPFEEFTSIDLLNAGTKLDVIDHVQELYYRRYFSSAGEAERVYNKVTGLIEKVVMR